MALVDLGNVIGPKGDTGATGPQGPQGPRGPQGPQGPEGTWSGASDWIFTDGATISTQDTPY